MKNARILLVDDDQPIRAALRRAFDREGYTVLEATNGIEALKVVESQPVDLVVTDIIMPDSEGIELTFALRKLHPTLPVIAMSGGGDWAPEPYLAIARTAGAAHVLVKPFVTDDLLACVRSTLGEDAGTQNAAVGE